MTPIRPAIELALIPALFHRALDGVRHDFVGDRRRAKEHHWRAIEASFAGLSTADARAASEALAIHRDRIERECKWADKLALVAYHLARILIDGDVLEIGDDALGKALDLTLPALKESAEDPEYFEAARKQATRVFRDMQRRGFYRQMTLEVQAA